MHEFMTGVKQILFCLHCKNKSYGKREERCEIHGDNFIKHKLYDTSHH